MSISGDLQRQMAIGELIDATPVKVKETELREQWLPSSPDSSPNCRWPSDRKAEGGGEGTKRKTWVS